MPCGLEAAIGQSSAPWGEDINITRDANHGQHISTCELQEAADRVRTLRRHKSSASRATTILRELALLESGGVKKSGGQAGDKNCNNNNQVEADWPDLYVYWLGGAEPTYDSLSLPEFIAGYLSIMEEVTAVCPMNVRLLRHISYLRQLMEDCFLTEWHLVCTAHKHMLNGIEHHRFSWEETAVVIDRKRTALNRLLRSSQTPVLAMTSVASQVIDSTTCSTPVQSTSVSIAAAPMSSNSVVCQLYQQLNCNFTNDHEVDSTIRLHCCAFCLQHNGFRHMHPQSACRKAKEANKAPASRNNKKRRHE